MFIENANEINANVHKNVDLGVSEKPQRIQYSVSTSDHVQGAAAAAVAAA